MKIRPAVADLLHIDGRFDEAKLFASRKFAKAPKKLAVPYEKCLDA
jgi:hypothetical protein